MTLIQCYFNFRADLYEEFTFKSMERAEGKEGDLFKVIKLSPLDVNPHRVSSDPPCHDISVKRSK
jgi:hypothetical protein